MTEDVPASWNNTSDIHLTAPIDAAVLNAFLQGVFAHWEKGRKATIGENGGIDITCAPDALNEIFNLTVSFALGIVKSTLEGAAQPIGNAYWEQGVKAGKEFFVKQLQNAPRKLPTVTPRAIDTGELVQSIGAEIRKAFEAGLEQGKGATDAIIEIGKLAKPSGEIVKVQRNGAGEIVGAVKQLIYDGNGGA